MARRIEVVDYRPEWPREYALERTHLARLFEPILVSIHHVGSTSVPDLAAKPVIDVLIVVSDDAALAQFDAGMETLGYRVRGECLDAGGTPGRFYYSKDTGGRRTHQVHICKAGHWEIEEMLSFAAFLRTHPERAEAYARVKRVAAVRNRHDIAGYIAHKDAFIKETILAARENRP